jgi:uncharacterized protein
MEAFHGRPLAELPVMLFSAGLAELLRAQGWGRVHIDLGRYDKGLIVVALRDSAFAELYGQSEKPCDGLFAGVLAGLFSHLSGEALDCAQTQCRAAGAADSRFVLTLPERLRKVPEWLAGRLGHDAIVAELESTRVE